MNNTKNNNQLQEFLTEYAKGNVTLADDGTVEKIEQSNQHFTLTITHEVLTSDIVQYVTFKQHENYTHGDDYNELSDVFDYDNVFSVTMADGEVIEIEEKTNEKAGTNMTNEIKTTTVEDWTGNVLETFEGEQTEIADETIQEMIYVELLNLGLITKEESFEDWEELYNAYREDYYIFCYDVEGNKVVWTW